MSHAGRPQVLTALLCLSLGACLLPNSALAQTTFTHVHMRVPDTAEAAAWHQALLGGEVVDRGPGQAVLHRNGLVMTMLAEGETPPETSRGGRAISWGSTFGLEATSCPRWGGMSRRSERTSRTRNEKISG